MSSVEDQNESWRERWVEGRTGWHRDEVHPTLAAHFRSAWHRVLVPLCGATVDLDWIADAGAEAIGFELSELAVQRVFERRGTSPELTVIEPFTRFAGDGLTVFTGDIFEATPTLFGPVDAVWDRAALVAIDPARRDDYVALLRKLAPGADLLLEVFEYPPGIIEGPPHAVSDAFVRAAFDDVELLDESVIPPEHRPSAAADTAADDAFVRRAYRGKL